MLAFTGLETVANLAEEARRPGRRPAALAVRRDRHRRHRLRRDRRRRRSRRSRARRPSSAPTGCARRSSASPSRSAASCRPALGDALRFFVGVSGALILIASVTTSISGFSRLAYSLGEHGQLPRAFGRLHRRTLVSPQAIVSVALISSAIVIAIVVHQARRRVPRERLLVRRAARVHRRAAGRDQAARSPSPTCRGRTARRSTSRSAARRSRSRRSSAPSSRSRSGSSRSPRTPARATPARPGSRSGSSSSSPCGARTARG